MRNLCVVFLLLLPSGAKAEGPITIHLAGDSTMAEKRPDKRPETGWGEFLQQHFDANKVRVENHAQNGRSTKTFIAEKRWQALVDKLKPGDYVFVQFGHNDQPKEKASHTPPADYRANLVRFVEEVRAKRATPVLMTPVVRRRFDEKGGFYDTHFDYPDIVRAVAAEHKVALIDMHRKSERALRRHGAEESKQLFLQLQPDEHANYPKGVEDNTHFSPRGAEEMAALAVEGVRELKLGLAKHLKKKSGDGSQKPE